MSSMTVARLLLAVQLYPPNAATSFYVSDVTLPLNDKDVARFFDSLELR